MFLVLGKFENMWANQEHCFLNRNVSEFVGKYFCFLGSKFCFLFSEVGKKGNIERKHNVSATMFPSLPRRFLSRRTFGKGLFCFLSHAYLLATSRNNSFKICQTFKGSTKETIIMHCNGIKLIMSFLNEISSKLRDYDVIINFRNIETCQNNTTACR